MAGNNKELFGKGERFMKKWILILAAALSALSGCGTAADNTKAPAQEGAGKYMQITQEEAKKMMDEQEVIIVDVRTEEEYAQGHIENAVLVPNESIADTPPAELPVDATLLIYCRSGNRSKQASQKLADMGYAHVYEFGGINDWSYEVVVDDGMETASAQAETAAEKEPEDVMTEDGETELTGEFAEFTSVDFEGNTVDQNLIAEADLTVLNIWGTFCGPCIQEMPDLGELADEYAGTGVQIVGIPADVYDEEGLRTAQMIIEETGADYVHLLPTQELYDIYLDSVSVVPTTVLIDKNGTIVDTVVGARSKEEWKTLIDEVKQGL